MVTTIFTTTALALLCSGGVQDWEGYAGEQGVCYDRGEYVFMYSVDDKLVTHNYIYSDKVTSAVIDTTPAPSLEEQIESIEDEIEVLREQRREATGAERRALRDAIRELRAELRELKGQLKND